ncbi:EAL domain-containing protein [Thiomonas intermedia]|uniref:EAL domain-containing protein n=1 Tax=Thiomonas intermedia TaxID=926 RepID=UPI0009A4B0DC|nr:EAL domain-containing protein [Thiomonas intermedia]
MQEREIALRLLDLPSEMLRGLAEGRPVAELAAMLCRMAEASAPGRIASVLRIGSDGALHPLTAPSSPPDMLAALDGLNPGPHAGSCGNAVFHNAPTFIEDIPSDDRWDDLRAVAEQWQLRSCWSWPVRDGAQVIGSFALTGLEPGAPNADERRLLEFVASMVGALLHMDQLQRERESAERLRQAMLDNALVAIALVGGRIIRSGNARMARMFGYPDTASLQGLPARALYADDAVFASVGAELYAAMTRGESVTREVPMRRSDGSLFWCELTGQAVTGQPGVDSVWVAQDVSERHAADERMRWQARHDALTRLPNRYALDEWLPNRLAEARLRGAVVAIGLLDLDDFKAINDLWGHAAGDAVLKQVAQQLGASLDARDLLARIGGDEFVLVIEGPEGDADIERRLASLGELLPLAVPLPEDKVSHLGLSLGLAVFPHDGDDPDTLLRRADAALHSIKLHKRTRQHWWLRWGHEVESDLIEDGIDHWLPQPYGPQAEALLRIAAPHYHGVAAAFIDQFYALVGRDAESSLLLSHLTPEEFTHLKARQVDHFRRLLGPELLEAEHVREATRIGEIHALVGVPTRLLVQSAGLYLQALIDMSHAMPARSRDRRRIVQLLTARMQSELQTEVEAAQALRERYQQCVIALEHALQDGAPWSEFMQMALDRLITLPGLKAAGMGAPDANGEFVVELSSGLEPFARAMQKHYGALKVPKLQGSHAESIGPTAAAWQTEQVCTLASYALDEAGTPWREAALEASIRSAASIPLTDRNGRVVVVLSLYGSYPAMFERSAARSFLDNLGQTLSRAWQRLHAHSRQQPVPVALRQRWRTSLFDHGLEMHLQPVVDLQTGKPYAVEALARLRMDDGSLAMPGQFLPWFGHAELSRLFRGGLEQTLAHIARWDTEGVRLNLSLNLPLDVLLQPDCRDRVAAALHSAGVAPERLSLEMLENAEFDDPKRRDDAVRELAATGVRLVMDDLGSGYSSLLRLRTLPFHTVKIDQSLVREAGRDPEQAIGFIGALVQLAQSLGLWVVVEGLETPDLVEAATLLGADAGQGYALARPMPAADVPNWVRHFHCPIDPRHPSTQLGRLALDWMAQHGRQLADESARRLLHAARRKALGTRA